MAISKILYIGDCGRGYHGKHLRQAIDYIMDPEKTGQGRLIGGMNCQPDKAYEQMRQTKKQFSKIDKRQGYHLILSFVEGEVDQDTAFEIVEKFVKEYLGDSYEAVFAVHDNTDHIHGHIIFNSVNFIDGRKFRYERGDWAKYIQPLTNRLCQEYGLSTIEIGAEREEEKQHNTRWGNTERRERVWFDMIKRDLDACIIQAPTFETFTELLSQKGYEVKRGKYLAVRPPGMSDFRRCKTLGAEYTEARIRERIAAGPPMGGETHGEISRIVRCQVKYYKRAGLSGIQKRYYSRLYRIGQLKKRPYSQAWAFKDEIRKMHQLEEEYLFLTHYDIQCIKDILTIQERLRERKQELDGEKRHIFKERARFKELFGVVQDLEELEAAENSYQSGDDFFKDEHTEWNQLLQELKNQNYSREEILVLKENFRSRLAVIREEEKSIRKKQQIVHTLLEETAEERNKKKAYEQVAHIQEGLKR